jgi:hypothetical protein
MDDDVKQVGSHARLREPTVRRRAVAALALAVMLATVCILFVHSARAWGFAADRHRRAREIAARESYLYQLLADRDAVFESQRRIYIERFRRLEAQIRQREQDVVVLRARLHPVLDEVPFAAGQQQQ